MELIFKWDLYIDGCMYLDGTYISGGYLFGTFMAPLKN